RGRDEVHRRLAPTRALDDERPAALRDERLDRGPLVLAQLRARVGDERAQHLLGAFAKPGAGRPGVVMAVGVVRLRAAGLGVAHAWALYGRPLTRMLRPSRGPPGRRSRRDPSRRRPR